MAMTSNSNTETLINNEKVRNSELIYKNSHKQQLEIHNTNTSQQIHTKNMKKILKIQIRLNAHTIDTSDIKLHIIPI